MALLSYGSNGDAVKELQTNLNTVGGYNLDVDGGFGKKTKAAVVDYQTKQTEVLLKLSQQRQPPRSRLRKRLRLRNSQLLGRPPPSKRPFPNRYQRRLRIYGMRRKHLT